MPTHFVDRNSLVRPLYLYVKKIRVGEVPGLREYVDEFTNEWTLGPDGCLVEEGLISLPKEEMKKKVLHCQGIQAAFH